MTVEALFLLWFFLCLSPPKKNVNKAMVSQECGSSMTRRKGTCGHMKKIKAEEWKDKTMEFMWGRRQIFSKADIRFVS